MLFMDVYISNLHKQIDDSYSSIKTIVNNKNLKNANTVCLTSPFLREIPTFKAVYIYDGWYPRQHILIDNCKRALAVPGDQHDIEIYKHDIIDNYNLSIKLEPNRILKIYVDSFNSSDTKNVEYVFSNLNELHKLLVDMIGFN